MGRYNIRAVRDLKPVFKCALQSWQQIKSNIENREMLYYKPLTNSAVQEENIYQVDKNKK